MSGELFQRTYALEDISIRAGGDGRTVEAYATVWDTPVEIRDQQGHYEEQISRVSFNRTLAQRGDKPWPVIFNHGLTLYSTPSERYTLPIGASIEPPRADSRGLVTVSRYHPGDAADEVLEAIRSGSVTAQSFSGKFVNSTPKTPRGGYRADRDGKLPLVTRTEVAMREYGPAVFAAYPHAAIVGVRAAAAGLSTDQTQLLNILLTQLAAADAAIDPIVNALSATDGALDAAQAVIASILAVPDPDDDDDMGDDMGDGMGDDMPMAMNSATLTSLARRLDVAITARASGTPNLGLAADDSPNGALGSAIHWQSLRLAMRQKGVLRV
jgi:phage head maturation protease